MISTTKAPPQHTNLNFDWQRQVSVNTLADVQTQQNDDFVVVVIGSLRGYGFSVVEQEQGADLLLHLLSHNKADYYAKVAGFFSAIIYDKKLETVELISDHIGSMPLYYSLKYNNLFISDSLNLFDEDRFELNPQAIFNYCFFHCIAAPTTIYKEVFKLEAGQSIVIDKASHVDTTLKYQPSYHYSDKSNSTLEQHCLSLISQAVGSHATPQCGAFLSGGLDSSTVAGMLAKTNTPAKTFSIGFESPQYDESLYAQLTAMHFNTKHYCHTMQPNELIENFKQVAAYFDQPFGNSSAMAAYRCATFAKEHGITKLLAGDGGDEIFAGNERYAKQGVFELFNKAPKLVQGMLEGVFCHTPLKKLALGAKAVSYIEQAKLGLPDRLDSYNFLNRFALDDIFTPQFLSQIDPTQPVMQKRKRYQQAKSNSHIESMLFLDWKFTLADNDLVKVSSMCQMAGVEVRYPLLEKELVDFSCQVKDTDKLKGQHLRHFFKGAVKGFLPDETLTKEKHGFGLPFGLWMTQSDELMSLAQASLTALTERQIFKPAFIELALEKHREEHSSYYGELIWILVTLELWLQSRDL